MNDQAIQGSTEILLNQGVLGVVIIGLVGFAIFLLKQNIKKDDRIGELQQMRVDDAKEITTKLKEPLAEQADLSRRIYEILLTGGRGGK